MPFKEVNISEEVQKLRDSDPKFKEAWDNSRIEYEQIEKEKSASYHLEIVEDTEEGGFVAFYPEFPGCISCGETEEKAASNAKDALKEWLTAVLEMQIEEKISELLSPESRMLARAAQEEIFRNGKATIICPKCHTHPKATTTSRGKRTILACKCGYIYDAEINF